MIEYFRKRWFLTCLVVAIPCGISFGSMISPESLESFNRTVGSQAGRFIVAFVLFLMSVTLDSNKLAASLRRPAPVFYAFIVNFAALPLIAIPLSKVQLSADFAAGVIITACVPSTMASASVWARKANGNDAVSLLCTILTNGLCFLITPFWLSHSLGDQVTLDTIEMMKRLFYTALIPIAFGQAVRKFARVREKADAHKTLLGSIAQICILILIFRASIDGGVKLQSSNSDSIGLMSVIVVWASCIFLHVTGLAIAFYGGQLFHFRREDIVAVSFSGSQKTLPIGVYIATGLLADRNLPFAVFPILMFHASQLIMDTMLIAPLAKWANVNSADGVNDAANATQE